MSEQPENTENTQQQENTTERNQEPSQQQEQQPQEPQIQEQQQQEQIPQNNSTENNENQNQNNSQEQDQKPPNPYINDFPEKTYGDNEDQNNTQNSHQPEPQSKPEKDPVLESEQVSIVNSQQVNPEQQQQFEKQQDRFTENQEKEIQSQFQQQYQKDQEQNSYRGFGEIDPKNIYFHHNQRILNNFFEQFKKELQEYFKDFASQNNGATTVSGSDLPLIARVGFYIDNITFHETKQDQEELFHKQNSYKKLIFKLSTFLELKSIPCEDINTFKIDFQLFLDFITYLVSTDPDIYLKRNDQSDYSGGESKREIENSSLNEGLIGEIKQSIEKYKKLLANTSDPGESKIILSTIQALEDQLLNLQQPVAQPLTKSFADHSFTHPNTSQLNKSRISLHTKEVRARNLKFIFNFYCSQKYAAGQGHTFDRIMREKNVLTLGKLTLFCKQFQLYNKSAYLTKKDIPSIFKKVTNNAKDLKEAEFKIFLEKCALAMFQGRDEEFQNDFEKIEEFYKFIHLDDMNGIKKTCKIISQPFNIQVEEGFRLLPKDKGRDVKVHQIDSRKLEELKQKKINDKQKMLSNMEYKGMDNSKFMGQQQGKAIDWNKANINSHVGKINPNVNVSVNVNKSQLGKSPNQSFQLNNANKYKYTYENYADRKVKNQESNIKQKQTFSWGELDKYTYEDMKQYQPGAFKPQDLFDENDDEEDKFYLKEYTLEQEKKEKKIQQEKQVHNVENYGKIQDKLRPTQKYLLKNDPSYDPQQRYYTTNVHKLHNSQDQQLINQQKDYYNIKKSPQTNHQPRYNITSNVNPQNIFQRHSSQGRLTTNAVYQNSIPQQQQLLQQQQQYMILPQNVQPVQQSQISAQYMKRADQLDGYSKAKQQKQMDRILQQQQRRSVKMSTKY